MSDKKTLKFIAQAAAGNVAFTSSRFQTSRELADFLKACDELEDCVDSCRRSERIDNGDGTVTLLREVTVPKEWLADGRDVVAVRAPKKGESFIEMHDGGDPVIAVAGHDWNQAEGRLIMSDAQPKFDAGKWYRNRSGELCGPLRRVAVSGDEWFWADGASRVYGHDGHARDISDVGRDLIPGEVTVWEKPPKSLPAGTWTWRTEYDGLLLSGLRVLDRDLIIRVLADWIDPPKPGRYKVPGDGKPAAWEDEWL